MKCEVPGCKEESEWFRWRLNLCDKHSEDEVIRNSAFHRVVAENAPAEVAVLHESLILDWMKK